VCVSYLAVVDWYSHDTVLLKLVCPLLQKDVYYQVVVDVINGVREAFLDEGMDEQVLLELKQVVITTQPEMDTGANAPLYPYQELILV